MSKRYEKASRENHRSFRYSLRLRMAVTEGVRNMYYEYAANKADEITHLRCRVVRAERLSGNNEGRLPGEEDDDDRANEVDDSIREIVSGYVSLDSVPRRMLINLRNNPVLLHGAPVLGNAEEGDDHEDDDDSVSDLEEQEEDDEEGDIEDEVMHVENMDEDSEDVINSDQNSNASSSVETVV